MNVKERNIFISVKTLLLILIVIILLATGSFYYLSEKPQVIILPVPTPVATEGSIKLLSTATFYCQNNRTIAAEFFETNATVGAATIGSVNLALSDGRKLELTQTMSADGARYATADESFVFWNKGNGALVNENGEEKDYKNCIIAAALEAKSDLTRVYAADDGSFSLRLPGFGTTTDTQYTTDASYTKSVAGATTSHGVSFTIPAMMASGTNLSADSYISIEQLDVTTCAANAFMDTEASTSIRMLGEMEYSFATSSEAAAGNRYEEQIYALPGSKPCIAIRYFIHSTAYENYPEGSITAFKRTDLLAEFDRIRKSLVINQ